MYAAYPPAGLAAPPHGDGEDDAGVIDLGATIDRPYVKPAGETDAGCQAQTDGDSYAYWIPTPAPGRCGCRGEYYRQQDASGRFCGCPQAERANELDMTSSIAKGTTYRAGAPLPHCTCPTGSQKTGSGANARCVCPAGKEANRSASRCVTPCARPLVRNNADVCVAPESDSAPAVMAAAIAVANAAQASIDAARAASSELPAAQRAAVTSSLSGLQANLTAAGSRAANGDSAATAVVNRLATQAQNIQTAVANSADLGRAAAAAPASEQAAIQSQAPAVVGALNAALSGTENSAQNIANQATIDTLMARVEQLTGNTVARVGEAATPKWLVPAAIGAGALILGLTGFIVYQASKGT